MYKFAFSQVATICNYGLVKSWLADLFGPQASLLLDRFKQNYTQTIHVYGQYFS